MGTFMERLDKKATVPSSRPFISVVVDLTFIICHRLLHVHIIKKQ